jgi:ABC-type phosphate transport system substrate-binding protein
MSKYTNLHNALVLNANNEYALRILADGGITISGPVTLSGEVEVTNDDGDPIPVSGSVTPVMVSAGHLSVTTSGTGSTYVAFSSQACKQLTISNDSGVSLEVQQGGSGVGFVVQDGTYYAFYGISNADQLSVRRKDVSGTQVTISARWEA